jgi:hypothetical protein
MTAVAQQFDPAVTSEQGDLWLASVQGAMVFGTFSGEIIEPGQSAILYVTITPSGARGTVVSGTLYVDDSVGDLPPYGQITADQVAALPYKYTVE